MALKRKKCVDLEKGERASRVFQEAAITLLTAWLGCNSLGSPQFSVSCERSDTTNTEEEGVAACRSEGLEFQPPAQLW